LGIPTVVEKSAANFGFYQNRAFRLACCLDQGKRIAAPPLSTLFRLLGALPLRLNHLIGAILGWLGWIFSSRHRRLTRENVARFTQTYPEDRVALRHIIAGQGRSISELAVAWTAPVERLYALVRACDGWEHVDAAKTQNKPIIFVTPHLGCYDIAGRYLESRIPITALYRPPKQKWLEPIMQAGRVRGEGSTARADGSGVRVLLKTLKHGGNIVLLPDQVPAPEQGGDGVWANFFGTPAFTMTLLPRLAESTGAAVLFFFAERLPRGAGYHVHIRPITEPFAADKPTAARQTNAMVESLIRMCPAQYLWGYNRYKRPAGAPPPT
jgi:Kdo2-lipid IVA lauroyltransferase/acyltransferase